MLTTCTSASIEDGWTRLSTTFTAPTTGTYTLYARTLWIYGKSSFDDLQLEEGSAASGYNLLTNGDVEWTDGWTFTSGASQGSSPIHGAHNIQITGKPSETRSASITIPLNLKSDNTFVLSGWAQADSVPSANKEDADKPTFALDALITYSDGATESQTVSFDNSSNHLQYASGNIVPKKSGKTISSITVKCVYGKNANTAHFDNICLRKEPIACYKYNSDGEVVAVNTKGNDQVNFGYSAGNLISEQSDSNGTYTYTYDSKHNLTKATNDGVEMLLTYDNYGHVTRSKVHDPSVATSPDSRAVYTFATYSDNGDYLESKLDQLGYKTTYETNSYGLTSSVTDPLSHTTSYTYNNNNDRMTRVSLDDGTSVNYTYGKGMISSIVRNSLLPDGTTAVNQTYSFTYDTYGNVTSVKVGTRTLASYTYMAKNGPLTKVTYGNGYTIEYGHDTLGLVVTEKRDGVLKYRYVYGSEGDLSRKEELNSSGTVVKATCYEYDSLDRLVRSWEETLSGGYLRRGLITQHIYDTSNRLTQQSWQYTDGTSKTEKYTYNNNDCTLTKLVTASGRTLNYTYDYLKRLDSKTDGIYTVSYDYSNGAGYRTSTQISDLTIAGPGSANWAYAYTYDKLGNITKVTQDGAPLAQYSYDAQSQLKKETLPQSGLTYEYTYDTAGNIRSAKTTQNGTATTKSYTYGDSNWKDLLTAVDGHTITYDALGNPLSYYNGQDWTFTWKDGRRLATAKSGSTNVSYNYDAEGLRTSKTVGGTTYNYTYLGNQLVRYSWGDNVMDFSYDEQGRPFAVTYNGVTYHYILNLQGDVIAIAGNAGGIWARYTYNAWGELIGTYVSPSGDVGTVNPLRYRGYVYDAESGLYYLNSRYYDPENARFLNADGYLSTGQGIIGCNMFSYCNNNPVNTIDPSGSASASGTAVLTGRLLQFLGTVLSETANAIKLSVPAYSGLATLALADGPLPFGDVVAAVGIVGLTIGSAGYSVYNASKTTFRLNNATKKALSSSLEHIAESYGNFKCREASDAMVNYLKKHNQKGSIVTISFIGGRGYIWSEMKKATISENGIHVGVQYNGRVYCNVHPYGLPTQTWIDDFWGTGYKTVTFVPFE